MDAIDRKILQLLQDDASQPLAEIAHAVNLSATPCWKRIQRLKKDGVIRKQVVLCDPKKLGYGAVAFVTVRTNQHNAAWLERFASVVQQIPEIVEVYRMTGDIDYLLRVVVRDIEGLDAVYHRLIHSVEMFDVSSSFAMEQIKYSTAVPVDGEPLAAAG